MLGRELPKTTAVEADRQHQHAAEHVRAVESGEHIEGASEDAIRDAESELCVVVHLADKEDHAEKYGHRQRAIHPLSIAPANAPHSELAGNGAQHEQGRHDSREERLAVQLKGGVPLGWPDARCGAQVEIRSEESGEEHDL